MNRRGFLGASLTSPLWGRAALKEVAKSSSAMRAAPLGVGVIGETLINSVESPNEKYNYASPPFDLETWRIRDHLDGTAYELRHGKAHDLDIKSYRSASPAWCEIQLKIRSQQREAVAWDLNEFSRALQKSLVEKNYATVVGPWLSKLTKAFGVKSKPTDSLPDSLAIVRYYLAKIK
jgi:hypothetical protein